MFGLSFDIDLQFRQLLLPSYVVIPLALPRFILEAEFQLGQCWMGSKDRTCWECVQHALQEI